MPRLFLVTDAVVVNPAWNDRSSGRSIGLSVEAAIAHPLELSFAIWHDYNRHSAVRQYEEKGRLQT